MAAKGNVLQSPECKTVSELQVNLLSDNIETVQIAAGENAVNNLVFISSKGITDYDDETGEERSAAYFTTTDGITGLDAVTNINVVVTNDDGWTMSYYVKQGKTIFNLGKSRIVDINFDDELLKKLAESGEFKVTSGQDLVSVIWSCDQHQNNQTITELKVCFLPNSDTQITSEIEQKIFQELRSEENQKLKMLITKLISVFNAKLTHIRTGCLQFVLTTESTDEAQQLVEKKAELTQIFTSTLIPCITESEIEINILPAQSKADYLQFDVIDLPYQSIPDDSFPDTFSIESDITDEDMPSPDEDIPSPDEDIPSLDEDTSHFYSITDYSTPYSASHQGIADSSQPDHSILLQGIPSSLTSENTKLCDCCRIIRSESKCHDCETTLCGRCTIAHNFFLPNSNHNIVKIGDIKTLIDTD